MSTCIYRIYENKWLEIVRSAEGLMSLLYTPVCEAGITADGFKYDIDNFMRSTDYLVMYLRCTSANWYLVNK